MKTFFKICVTIAACVVGLKLVFYIIQQIYEFSNKHYLSIDEGEF